MMIFTKGFEKQHKDKIAVIYELNSKINKDGFIETEKIPVKINHCKQIYYLDPYKDYLIICALSAYRVKGNDIETTFISKKHPLYVE